MAKFSTGLRNKMLDTNSFKTIFAAGFIKVYTGTPPADADAAVTGTLLATFSISGGGTGVNFASAAASGAISKASAEVWSSTPVATGTGGYYRHVAAGDTGASSTTEARIQGTVALAGGDMNVSNTTFTSGVPRTIDTYAVALPTL